MEEAATRKRKSRAKKSEEAKQAARAMEADRMRKRRRENSANEETKETIREQNRLQQPMQNRCHVFKKADASTKESWQTWCAKHAVFVMRHYLQIIHMFRYLR